jgi:hypothetical protein
VRRFLSYLSRFFSAGSRFCLHSRVLLTERSPGSPGKPGSCGMSGCDSLSATKNIANLPIPQKSANKQKLLLLLLLLSSSISLVCSLNMEIVTPDEVLQYGLCMSGMDLPRQMKRNRSSRLQKFNDLYGSKPVVYAAIWEDILLSDDPGIRVEGNDRTVTGGLHKLLMACMFLYCYPTGSLLSSFFKIC